MGALSLGGARCPERGSALIAVLLTMTVMMILGMAFLSRKSAQYETAVRATGADQARALAQAGLVDIGSKFAKDRTFPPARPEGNTIYSYSEDLSDTDGKVYGGYTLTCDSKLAAPPHSICQVTSEGFLGTRASPKARFRIYAEMDMARDLRADSNTPNPMFRRWSLYHEAGLPNESALP